MAWALLNDRAHIENSSYKHCKQDALILLQSKQTLIFGIQDNLVACLHTAKEAPSWWSELPLPCLIQSFNRKFSMMQ